MSLRRALCKTMRLSMVCLVFVSFRTFAQTQEKPSRVQPTEKSRVVVTEASPTVPDEYLRQVLDDHVKWLSSSFVGSVSRGELSIVSVFGDSVGMRFEAQIYCGPVTTHLEDKGIHIRQRPGQTAFDWARDVEDGARSMGCNVAGRRAKLADLDDVKLLGADLRFADLEHSDIEDADLEGVQLTGAKLENAYIINHANLSHASMYGADIRSAKIWDSSLVGADLRHADLSNSEFRRTDLTAAQLDFANLQEVWFEPTDVSGTSVFGASGLDSLSFDHATAAVQLRKACKDAGLGREERALTSSIKKNEMKTESSSSVFFEKYLLGGKLTNYGVQPWLTIAALFAFIPVFALFYALALTGRGHLGIWVVHYVDGPIEKDQRAVPVRARHGSTCRFLVGLVRRVPVFHHWKFLAGYNQASSPRRQILGADTKSREFSKQALEGSLILCCKTLFCLRVGFYFSCLSAFQIGWKDFNIGAWLTRLQSRPYTLRATGWVRTVSGLQALLSLYLLVMWALTYFGNPFE